MKEKISVQEGEWSIDRLFFSVLHLSWLPMKTDNYSEVRH